MWPILNLKWFLLTWHNSKVSPASGGFYFCFEIFNRVRIQLWIYSLHVDDDPNLTQGNRLSWEPWTGSSQLGYTVYHDRFDIFRRPLLNERYSNGCWRISVYFSKLISNSLLFASSILKELRKRWNLDWLEQIKKFWKDIQLVDMYTFKLTQWKKTGIFII